MQYEVKEVSLDEILFNENNPRQDMGDLKELAASFADGEPYTPPIVARDGSKYRLFDGERRVRAMQLLGTERCHVNVYPTFVAAEAAIASMATNLKKSLDTREKAKGFQTMLEYDLSDEDMRRATGMEMEQVRGVRRVISAYDGDKQLDMDAIFEAMVFEDLADQRRVLDAGVYASREAQSIRWERANAKKCQKIHDAIRRCGVPDENISDELAPKNEAIKEMGLHMMGYVSSPKDAKTLLGGYKTELVRAWLSDRSYEVSYIVYIAEAEYHEDPKEVLKRRNSVIADRLNEMVRACRSSMVAWYVAAYEQSGAKFTRINTAVCKSRDVLSGIDESLAAMYSVSRPSMYEVCAWICASMPNSAFDTAWNTHEIRYSGPWSWRAEDAAKAWQLLAKAGWQVPEGAAAELGEAFASVESLAKLVEQLSGEQA